MRQLGYDGCTLCEYEGKSADEEPCKTCKRAMIDHYRRKTNGGVIRSSDNRTIAKIIMSLQGQPDLTEGKLYNWLNRYAED